MSAVTYPSNTPPGKPTPAQIRQLKLIDCFAKETWTALCFALVCLVIDGYAMIAIPHHHVGASGPEETLFATGLWVAQVLLAVLALWLVGFAFSRPPRMQTP